MRTQVSREDACRIRTVDDKDDDDDDDEGSGGGDVVRVTQSGHSPCPPLPPRGRRKNLVFTYVYNIIVYRRRREVRVGREVGCDIDGKSCKVGGEGENARAAG